MAQLNAYLTFKGNCREAMEFYKACLGGELELMEAGQAPPGTLIPEKKDLIMHSVLKKDGMVLMASDMIMKGKLTHGNNVTLCITGGTPEDLKTVFAKLAAGGKIGHDLKEEFFGLYGDLTDKFGIHWMFQAEIKK